MSRAIVWIQNLSVVVCSAGMLIIAKMCPSFGGMYEGLGRLPWLTNFIYHPLYYWVLPVGLLLALLVANFALLAKPERRALVISLTLLISVGALTTEIIGLYQPIQRLNREMDSSR